MSTPISPAQRIEQLRKEIAEHDERYYRNAAPVISDFEYDKVLRELENIENDFPNLVTPSSTRHILIEEL